MAGGIFSAGVHDQRVEKPTGYGFVMQVGPGRNRVIASPRELPHASSHERPRLFVVVSLWCLRAGRDPLELRRYGRRVKVRPQSLKLLRLLVDGRRTTVPRDAIQAAIWGADVFVDVEQGVNHCIKELRAALRDDAESPRFIQTIPRQGYRFIAPVEAVAASPAPIAASGASAPVGQPAHRAAPAAWGWGLLTAALVLAALVVMAWRQSATGPASLDQATVAVLPFAVGNSESPPYLGVSIADAVIAGLARQGAITVRPLAAVMRYESSPVPAVEVAQALGVDMVVTGGDRAGRSRQPIASP